MGEHSLSYTASRRERTRGHPTSTRREGAFITSQPFPPTMTANPSNDSTSIFNHGRVKPGIYKIYSIYHQSYLDIQERTMQLRCYPARDLEEGRGLVSIFAVCVFDDYKWEIKNLGIGYAIKRVSELTDTHLAYRPPPSRLTVGNVGRSRKA